jgi:hypothetical protein
MSSKEFKAGCERIEAVAPKLIAQIEELERWVDQAVDDTTIDMSEVARAFFYARTAHEVMDAVAKRLYHVKNHLDKSVLPARMEANDTDMVRLPDVGHSFSVQSKMSASLINKEAGFEWLRSIGQGDIIQETVNASTLSAFVRSQILEEGVDPPEDVVRVNTYKTISVRKYNPK